MFFKLGTIDIHAQDIEKMQENDGVTMLVCLHAFYFKRFFTELREKRLKLNQPEKLL